ncbi:MAG: hypothetical protein EMLJLAPB_00314 [Candidatus Argoarchaeum ethanivorans]|uniref:Uncharacterized protein n=1 Tax=Candidatus Argoarchaeum ethanivorans TaxID=2608793 RepID=A0A811T4F4_9EURY|nr:MAG: hypothetical protein KFBDDELM_00097 [Candidatus Argoarchaeum ethanivorans]CAD6490725.1 MAG: hypothetical protein FFODKBPE_00008 [Candidatus Argoarchaeum ethanivorans]CAD6492533.1 MAG: hypothetical protein EMLJLAPB_00314 [Candidatus Argoarchaeum ethanivorans]
MITIGSTDKYKTACIFKGILKSDKDEWAYYLYNDRHWKDRNANDRDFREEYYPIKIDHVDLSTIMTDREYRNQDEYIEFLSQPQYYRGDVIMCKNHLHVVLDYNETTDKYKTAWVLDTAIGLCYAFPEESSTFGRWQSREYLEDDVLFIYLIYGNGNVDPSTIKSREEYYNWKYS